MLEKLAAAAAARKGIYETGTDVVRLADGEGDGFPEDLHLDDFAGRWLLQTRGDRLPEWARRITPPVALYWKRLDRKSPPEWVAGERVSEPFAVCENGLRFWIDFGAGYSQGFFIDQRSNRAEVRATAAGKKVLNCFAYTCAFGVAAAAGGGETMNVDLSRRYLDWGKRNYELNRLAPAGGHEFISGDVFEWMRRFGKKQRRFDLIILDPPTFSRDRRGKVFTVESQTSELVRLAAGLLGENGRILCCTNQRGLGPGDFRELIAAGLDHKRGLNLRSSTMPPDFSGAAYLKTFWVGIREKG